MKGTIDVVGSADVYVKDVKNTTLSPTSVKSTTTSDPKPATPKADDVVVNITPLSDKPKAKMDGKSITQIAQSMMNSISNPDKSDKKKDEDSKSDTKDTLKKDDDKKDTPKKDDDKKDTPKKDEDGKFVKEGPDVNSSMKKFMSELRTSNTISDPIAKKILSSQKSSTLFRKKN